MPVKTKEIWNSCLVSLQPIPPKSCVMIAATFELQCLSHSKLWAKAIEITTKMWRFLAPSSLWFFINMNGVYLFIGFLERIILFLLCLTFYSHKTQKYLICFSKKKSKSHLIFFKKRKKKCTPQFFWFKFHSFFFLKWQYY